MQIFKINKNLEVVCKVKKTRGGFNHEATLLRNGLEVLKVKICYLNRTWEAFEFNDVLEKLAGKTGEKAISRFVKNRTSDSGTDQLKTVGTIAKLGEIFCAGDQKATNDWKTRIIKAGLGDRGLTIPDDWDQLNEKEKERRLNGVIALLKG